MHYAYSTSTGVMTDLRQAFEFMTDTNTCVVALQEGEHYRRKQGSFSSELVAQSFPVIDASVFFQWSASLHVCLHHYRLSLSLAGGLYELCVILLLC
jgi:hypothetical protein